MKSTLLKTVPIALALAGCANTPTDRLVAGAEDVTVATTDPGAGYERLRTVTGYGGRGCGPASMDSARRKARNALLNTAHAEGADYVQLVGTGPAEERGHCVQDVFRLSGIAYRAASDGTAGDAGNRPSRERAAGGEANPETPPEPAATGSRSAAEQLDELERLRERELISDDEYRELRQRVLDQAF